MIEHRALILGLTNHQDSYPPNMDTSTNVAKSPSHHYLNHLESLSVELLVLVMIQISSLKDLYSSVRTSPRKYGAFNLAKERVLAAVIRNSLHPEVFHNALIVVTAKQELPRDPTRELLREFFQRFDNQSKASRFGTVRLTTSIHMLRLLSLVGSYIHQFPIDDLRDDHTSLPDIPPRRPLYEPALSCADMRIYKAFLRYEVWALILFIKPHEQSDVNMEAKKEFFLDVFGHVHFGDIKRISDFYMRFRGCWTIFRSIEDDSVKSKAQRES